jgi:hypothetical protein
MNRGFAKWAIALQPPIWLGVVDWNRAQRALLNSLSELGAML